MQARCQELSSGFPSSSTRGKFSSSDNIASMCAWGPASASLDMSPREQREKVNGHPGPTALSIPRGGDRERSTLVLARRQPLLVLRRLEELPRQRVLHDVLDIRLEARRKQ